MLRVMIADDHPVVRRGLRQIIEESPDMVVVDEAEDGSDALAKTRTGEYDIVLLDISMPGKDGLEVLRQLRNDRSSVPALVLSMYPEAQYAVQALRAGASGYMTKESAPNELVAAIRKVCAGGKYVSSSLAERLASYVQKDTQTTALEMLSSREYQVMRLIASGRTPTEIARDLCLSVKTVSTYRGRILEKLNLKNSAALTHYAVKNGVID